MDNKAAPINPFSLMMEPERVREAMARSTQLRALRRHQLHPLDKPLIPHSAGALNDLDAHDTFDAMRAAHAPDALDDYLLN